MKMLELVSYLRTNILDDTGGQGVDWSSYSENDYDSYQLRWSNEELVSNINEAINQVYRRVLPVKDILTIDIFPDKDTYRLPPFILKIVQIRSDKGLQIDEVDIEDIWYSNNDYKRQGEPNVYTSDYLTNTIKLYPVPTSHSTFSAIVYRLPVKQVTFFSSEDVELKDEFILPMLYYAASLCYMKDEANVLDPNRVQYFMNLFDKEFPFTSSYSTLRKSRTSNKAIKYGGL